MIFTRKGTKQTLSTSLLVQDLLYSIYEWRNRRVEQIVPVSEDAYESQISLQLTIPYEKIQRAGGAAGQDPVDIVLPIVALRKRPLMGFSITMEDRALVLFTRFQGHELTYDFLSQRIVRNFLEAADAQFLDISSLALKALVTVQPEDIALQLSKDTNKLSSDWLTIRENDVWSALSQWLADRLSYWTADRSIILSGINGRRDDLMNLVRLGSQVAESCRSAGIPVDVSVPLTNPLFNPILLIPDFWAILDTATRKPDEFHQRLSIFRESAETLLRQLAVNLASANSETRARAGYVLSQLDFYVHNWIAYVPITVIPDKPFIVKVRQLLPLTEQAGASELGERARRVAFYLPVRRLKRFREWCYSKYGGQAYPLGLGDARSSHIEVSTPASSEFLIDHRRCFVEAANRRLSPEEVFGSVTSYQEHGVIHFYTARRREEFDLGLRALGVKLQPEEAAAKLWVIFNLEPGLRWSYRLAVTLGLLTAIVSAIAAHAAFSGHSAPSSYLAYLDIVASLLAALLLFRPVDPRALRRVSGYKWLLLAAFVLMWGLLAAQALGLALGWLPAPKP